MADSMVLSDYEREREKNIQKNEEFLASLNLLQHKRSLYKSNSTVGKKLLKRSEKFEYKAQPLKMSLRSRSTKEDTSPPELTQPTTDETSNGVLVRRTGKTHFVDIIADSHKDSTNLEKFLKHMQIRLQEKVYVTESSSSASERLLSLQNFEISSDHGFSKVVPHRIYSVAFANTAKPIVLAGDKWGYLGLWFPHEHEQPLTLQPHVRAVSRIMTSDSSNCDITTCSYDGTVRSMNIETAMYDTILDHADMLFHDIASVCDPNVLLTVSGSGHAILLDKREHKPSNPVQLHEKKISSVDFHSNGIHFCTASGDQTVCVWDVRSLSSCNNGKPKFLSKFCHTKAVTAARFSHSGSYILTTCYDNYIRIFHSSCGTNPKESLFHKIPHNNNTGRWVTPFAANWDSQCEDIFMCGSMEQPRGIDVFSIHHLPKKIRMIHNNLTTIVSRIVSHQSTGEIMGGSSSGRVFTFC
eukprot:jgi/Galph1/485/GphlegSOOS_G5148.1